MKGLFNWGSRKEPERPAAEAVLAPPSTDPVLRSKVLPRFLDALAHATAPVLLDLGPVVGANISFLGDRLPCKIHVEDLFSDVEAHARRGDREGLSAALAARLGQPPESVDGILCWDLFDFLDRPAGRAVAQLLVKLLRKRGVLHGFFGTTAIALPNYTRFVIESEDTLRLRAYPATLVPREVLLTRDIIKMFDGLIVAESVLLKSNTREKLFRKP